MSALLVLCATALLIGGQEGWAILFLIFALFAAAD